jgi:hypothetical protein
MTTPPIAPAVRYCNTDYTRVESALGVTLPEPQRRACNIIGALVGGFHNYPGIDLRQIRLSSFRNASFPWRGSLASYDAHHLVTLLTLADAHGLRVSITPKGSRALWITFTARDTRDQPADWSTNLPPLDDIIAHVRAALPKPSTPE